MCPAPCYRLRCGGCSVSLFLTHLDQACYHAPIPCFGHLLGLARSLRRSRVMCPRMCLDFTNIIRVGSHVMLLVGCQNLVRLNRKNNNPFLLFFQNRTDGIESHPLPSEETKSEETDQSCSSVALPVVASNDTCSYVALIPYCCFRLPKPAHLVLRIFFPTRA